VRLGGGEAERGSAMVFGNFLLGIFLLGNLSLGNFSVDLLPFWFLEA
jgi:hypothetical protein